MQDALIVEAYQQLGSVHKVASAVSLNHSSVHERLVRLGIPRAYPRFSDIERDRLRQVYVAHRNNGTLRVLAHEMRRTVQFLCRQARALGLSDPRHVKIRSESQHKVMSERAKARWNNDPEHRRRVYGYLIGKTPSAETRRKLSVAGKRVAAGVSSVEWRRRSDQAMRTKLAKYGTGRPGGLTSITLYSRAKRGKREDLGNIFFRSRWEANYARYLKWLKGRGDILQWKYEPKTFIFHGVIRGVLTYTPDFEVTEKNGLIEYHEVKGWMDAKSKAKLKRMATFYPDVKIILVDSPLYREITKKLSAFIPEWETE